MGRYGTGIVMIAFGAVLAFAVLDMFPDLEDEGIRNPLDPKNAAELPAILKETATKDDAEEAQLENVKMKQAVWTHQLHFVGNEHVG